MKKILIILSTTLFFINTARGQNLFFIDEISYPCTNIITLVSNSEDEKDLDLIFAKDENNRITGVSTKTIFTYETFHEKLIIYLEDGSVITCADLIVSENVDRSAIAAYFLSPEDLNKLKRSDIHTVRYTLIGLSEIKYSASNKGNNTKTIITDFFEDRIKTTIDARDDSEKISRFEAERIAREEEQRKINEINSRTQGAYSSAGAGGQGKGDGKSQGVTFPGGNQGVPAGDPNSNNYGAGGSGSGEQGSGISFSLSGRSAYSFPKPRYPGDDAGIVVVKITVDKSGNVTAAESGARGTTIMNKKFWEEAKQAALKAKFNSDNNASKFQQGTISYRFVLD